MEWIRMLYIGATIFGAGVTIADMIGVFSNLGSGDGDEAGGDGEIDADVGDADTGGADADVGDGDGAFDAGEALGDGDADGTDTDSGTADDTAELDEVSGDEESGPDSGPRESIIAHDRRQRRNPVIMLLTGLRTLVYFSLGFGPVGWFATTQYPGVAATLAWSIPVGAVVAVGTRALRAFMRRDLSSTIGKEDVLMEKGIVTVSIGSGAVGRVRIALSGVYVERFAKASDATLTIPTGATIRVVDADDEYVYVEPE